MFCFKILIEFPILKAAAIEDLINFLLFNIIFVGVISDGKIFILFYIYILIIKRVVSKNFLFKIPYLVDRKKNEKIF